MIDFSHFNSIFELTEYFNTEDKCRRAIFESRWDKKDYTIWMKSQSKHCIYLWRHKNCLFRIFLVSLLKSEDYDKDY